MKRKRHLMRPAALGQPPKTYCGILCLKNRLGDYLARASGRKIETTFTLTDYTCKNCEARTR